MREWAPGGTLASNVEVTAATVQRGDIIQLGGRACRVQDLFQLSQGAKQILFESGEYHTHANPARRRAHDEAAVIRSVPPRHHEIANDLRHQITTGRLKTGERLTSECDLASRYKVSTATLRSALAVLQSEGLVEKIHGKGNFVRRPLRRIMYVGGWGTLDPWTAAETALRVTVRTGSVQADGHLTTLLRVPTGSPLAEFFCVSHEGESPHGLARIYIPRDLAPAGVLDDEFACPEAVRRFAVLGPPPAAVRETLCARPPTPDESSTLRTNSVTPVLAITRVATDPTGRVIEAALLVFPGDRADAVFTTHHTPDERQTAG